MVARGVVQGGVTEIVVRGGRGLAEGGLAKERGVVERGRDGGSGEGGRGLQGGAWPKEPGVRIAKGRGVAKGPWQRAWRS